VDLHESIAEATERELFEECGIQAKFESVLGFRETLRHPGVHLSRADIFFITKMRVESASNFEIAMCERELLDDAWIPVSEVGSDNYPIYGVVKALLSTVTDGQKNGWDSVEIKQKEFENAIMRNGEPFSFFRQ